MSYSNAEQLEEYAAQLGMTPKEIAEFCITELVAITEDDGNKSSEQVDEALAYLNTTINDPEWFVKNMHREQGWDLPASVGFATGMINWAMDHNKEFDT